MNNKPQILHMMSQWREYTKRSACKSMRSDSKPKQRGTKKLNMKHAVVNNSHFRLTGGRCEGILVRFHFFCRVHVPSNSRNWTEFKWKGAYVLAEWAWGMGNEIHIFRIFLFSFAFTNVLISINRINRFRRTTIHNSTFSVHPSSQLSNAIHLII